MEGRQVVGAERSAVVPDVHTGDPNRLGGSVAGEATVAIEDLAMTYPRMARAAVEDFSLLVESGEFVSLLGPSGCGKTTTLKCVAGLETPVNGRITIGGLRVHENGVDTVPIHKRPLGMVFQSYAIWPHMTVAENVAFPLQMRGWKRSNIRRRVTDSLERVHMSDFADRPATQLSGGQQQRIAIARAIVAEPDLLLLDEPLSNLDASLRRLMRTELLRIQKELGITTIYVTHDQVEACALSDRIALMRDGHMIQVASPEDAYARPNSEFVARFMGTAEVLPGRIERVDGAVVLVRIEDDRDRAGGLVVHSSNHAMSDAPVGAPVSVVLRPEHVRFEDPESVVTDRDGFSAKGRVAEAVFLGDQWEVYVDIDGQRLMGRILGQRHVEVGDVVHVAVREQHLRILPRAD